MRCLEDVDVPVITRAMMRGDEQAWRRFHDSYYELLSAAAASRGVAVADVPDVIQRTYLRVIRYLKVFEDDAGFRAWLCCQSQLEIPWWSRRLRRVSQLKLRCWFTMGWKCVLRCWMLRN